MEKKLVMDVTPYLAAELRAGAAFFESYDQGFEKSRKQLLTAALAMRTKLYRSHLKFFGSMCKFDIKRTMRETLGDAVVLSGGEGTRWVDYSAPGNILFGYLSAARGLDRKVCWAAGGLLESIDVGYVNRDYRKTWYDNPGDKAAVDFGWDLFDEVGTDVDLAGLQTRLKKVVLDQLQAPISAPIEPPMPYDGPLTEYPYPSGTFLV